MDNTEYIETVKKISRGALDELQVKQLADFVSIRWGAGRCEGIMKGEHWSKIAENICVALVVIALIGSIFGSLIWTGERSNRYAEQMAWECEGRNVYQCQQVVLDGNDSAGGRLYRTYWREATGHDLPALIGD